MKDPIADEWELRALCKLGIATDPDVLDDCPENEILQISAQFARSLPDEFRRAILGDLLVLFPIAYGAMFIYLCIFLSRMDSVYSNISLSGVALLCVILAYAAGMGLGGLLGIPNSNLTGNIPFLLLGLGVDDAFVLVSEFNRAVRNDKGRKKSQSELAGETLRDGGLSILITSATDALAFLIGSSTVLPALGWFCQMAGIGIIFCFLFQVFIFLPALIVNYRRTEAGRLDVLCCFKGKKHDPDDQQGCLFTCFVKPSKSGRLSEACGKWAELIAGSQTGKMSTCIVFLALAIT